MKKVEYADITKIRNPWFYRWTYDVSKI